MVKYVYDSSEGDKSMKDLLGGEKANLAGVMKLGLPVPPGFTIMTEAYRAYLKDLLVPESLAAKIAAAPRGAEDQAERTLGDSDSPLLVSVRSDAKFSMSGMMEAALNIGLDDQSVLGLVKIPGDERFAWDSYRCLIQMSSKTVPGIDGDLFSDALDSLKAERGVTGNTELTVEDLKGLVVTFRKAVSEQRGMDFPQDPRTQMDVAIEAVFRSWNTERARTYRHYERIPHDLGTVINVCTMVFGNMDEGSGTGVYFTHDPSSGHSGVHGDYLENAQGEDVVAGIRNILSLADLENVDKAPYDKFRGIMRKLEIHYCDMCDIKFTVERGKLQIFQARIGRRTAAATFRIAIQFVEEKLIIWDEILVCVTGDQLTQLIFPRFDQKASKEFVAQGTAASPGATAGRIAFDNAQAEAFSVKDVKCVLVRRETNSDDLPGMVVAEDILAAYDSKTSHAAIVARDMGKTYVCGAEVLEINAEARIVTIDGRVFTSDDTIAIDGQTDEIFPSDVPITDPPVITYLAEGLETDSATAGTDGETRGLVKAVSFILTYTGEVRHLRVRVNTDTPADSCRSTEFGIEGIGLCRTEYMLLGSYRPLVERAILSIPGSGERTAVFAKLEKLQRQDFLEMFEVIDGKSMTVRLIDPPLHELMSVLSEFGIKVAVTRATGEMDPADRRMLVGVRRFHEQSPMLGPCGVRLGIYLPGLFALQMRALCEAAADLVARGLDPKPEVMIPLVGSIRELRLIREKGETIIAEVQEMHGINLSGVTIGAMIELPRVAMTAEDFAEKVDFFFFGMNGLTQAVRGFSYDDVEGVFFP